LLIGTFLEAAADLPGTQSGELCDEECTNDERQPGWQRLFRFGVHAILPTRIQYESTMKLIVLILLAAILISLGSGLFYLSSKNHDSKKIQYALRIRVALSVILVLFLVVSYLTGQIQA
jgi:hypothetical protein